MAKGEITAEEVSVRLTLAFVHHRHECSGKADYAAMAVGGVALLAQRLYTRLHGLPARCTALCGFAMVQTASERPSEIYSWRARID